MGLNANLCNGFNGFNQDLLETNFTNELGGGGYFITGSFKCIRPARNPSIAFLVT